MHHQVIRKAPASEIVNQETIPRVIRRDPLPIDRLINYTSQLFATTLTARATHVSQQPVMMTLRIQIIALLLTLLTASGCSSMVSRATSDLSDNLSSAVLDQNDPETVRQGAPAFLLMIDGFISGDPDNQALLLTGSRLYGAYASAFVEDEARQKRLAEKSYDYGRQAVCLSHTDFCAVIDEPLAAFKEHVTDFRASDVPVLFGFAAGWATWIQANTDDWSATIQLPKVAALMERVIELDETYDHGNAHLYLGVLSAQLPPEYGGKPEVGRQHFERANELSNGHNLMVNTLFAKYYARLVFDRDLHDRLLEEVLASDIEAPGLTLSNALAQQDARVLLEGSNDFF